MKSRQFLIRLALLNIAASFPFVSFCTPVFSNDTTPILVEATSGNNVPVPSGIPGVEESRSSAKTSGPGPERSDSESPTDPQLDSDTGPAVPVPRKRSPRSQLLPTEWKSNTRLIPTEIESNILEIESPDPEPRGKLSATHPSQGEGKKLAGTGLTPYQIRNGVPSQLNKKPVAGSNRVKRTVYTQPGSPQSVVRQKSQSPEPLLDALFFPVLGVNSALGVGKFSGVASAPAKPREATPNWPSPQRSEPSTPIRSSRKSTSLTQRKKSPEAKPKLPAPQESSADAESN